MSIWINFDEQRPYGRLFIMLTDGKHLGYFHTYKEDWLKEWENFNPELEEKCALCCQEMFTATHWASGWILVKELASTEVSAVELFMEESKEEFSDFKKSLRHLTAKVDTWADIYASYPPALSQEMGVLNTKITKQADHVIKLEESIASLENSVSILTKKKKR